MPPEFIRLPPKSRPGESTRCEYTGLSRSGLYNLCVPCAANKFKPAVPAKRLRQPGNLTGVWLIPYGKLMAYLNALPDGVDDMKATGTLPEDLPAVESGRMK